MAYGSKGVKRKALTNFGTNQPNKRRRVTLATRVRRRRPTAENQKKQILALTKKVYRNSRLIKAGKVFTDYQWGDPEGAFRGYTQALGTGTWYSIGLTDFNYWQPCMRQDANVQDSQRTYCAKMQINCRLDMNDVDTNSFINIFLVTPRRDSTLLISQTPPPVGAMTQLTQNEDFIENTNNQGVNVRLNTGKFHVHACKYITLTPNTLNDPLPASGVAGNAFSTWRKWQWNVPLKFTVSSPINKPWNKILFNDLPYYRKFYLLAYSVSTNSTTPFRGPKLDVDILSTCINFD